MSGFKFITVKDPKAKTNFRSIASTKEEVKAGREANLAAMGCSQCWKKESEIGRPLRFCGGCKNRYYCSEQCQRANWRVHKPNCSPDTGFLKLASSFFANRTLMLFLDVCCIFEFGLLQHRSADKLMMVHVNIGIEPADSATTMAILMKQQVDTSNVIGMVQINDLRRIPDSTVPSQARLKLWREAKTAAAPDVPVVVIEIAKGLDRNSVTTAIPISEAAFKAAADTQPLRYTSPITGQTREMPMSGSNMLEFLNHHIRSDRSNQLLLRTKMKEQDLQILRDVARGDMTQIPVLMFRVKMEREPAAYTCYQVI